ncbi:hypothetical protein M0R04_16235 [Candidatus Dojkabacteria bacterium]|jgi:hypothetical protein|nr:hypothetical protein [Candidatus Dojkabacteria bacterium]
MKININFLFLLTLVFIVLKLQDYIAWSWWWVFAPLWMPWAVVLLGLAILLIGGFIAVILER